MLRYPACWTRVSWRTFLLAPLSALYLAGVTLRRLLYAADILRKERLPLPVVVVGNISVGGTGKTPLVLWLAARLRQAGYRPGIISRGYGGSAHTPQAVFGNSDARQCGDEPVLLARRSGCAVWIGRNRPAVARALIHANPECNVIVSDDGLQHYRLARDMEIAVLDAARAHGNGWPMPAGPLRELPYRLGEVDAVVVRDAAAAAASGAVPQYGMTLEARDFRNLRDAGRRVTAGHFKGLRVHAVAGIGHPQQFFDQLTRLGVAHTPHAFPDHHPYSASDLEYRDCDAVVMTEKDAVKCERIAGERQWALQVDAHIDESLAQLVLARIKGKR